MGPVKEVGPEQEKKRKKVAYSGLGAKNNEDVSKGFRDNGQKTTKTITKMKNIVTEDVRKKG